MTLALFGAAVGLLILALTLQHFADVAATRMSETLRKKAEDRKEILESVMSSAHHQMSREIMLLAFATDDLTDEGVDTAELYEALHNLESARDTIAVLAQIGGTDSKVYPRQVTADDLAPSTTMNLEIVTIEPVLADPILMRAAVAAGAMDFAERLGMTDMRLVVDRNTIRLEVSSFAPFRGPGGSEGADDTGAFVSRIVEAHDGTLEVERVENGFICTATLPEYDPSQIDPIDLDSALPGPAPLPSPVPSTARG
ncbi:MAG: hypothetical protein ACN4GZ_13110 [Acidimicrobiales bacterium]